MKKPYQSFPQKSSLSGPVDRIMTNIRKIQLSQQSPFLTFAVPDYLRRITAAALYLAAPEAPEHD